jgi:hypothetical protein
MVQDGRSANPLASQTKVAAILRQTPYKTRGSKTTGWSTRRTIIVWSLPSQSVVETPSAND